MKLKMKTHQALLSQTEKCNPTQLVFGQANAPIGCLSIFTNKPTAYWNKQFTNYLTKQNLSTIEKEFKPNTNWNYEVLNMYLK